MRIGTTPTHYFTLPFSTELIKDVQIIYCQNGSEILQKNTPDCEFEGNTVSVKLSQLDTFEFAPDTIVEIQIRVSTDDETVLASDILKISCQKCLSEEVL